MWVRSEYAGELAVLSAWISVLVPWNIVYHARAPMESSIFFLRFAFLEIQLRSSTVAETVDGQRVELDVASLQATQYPGSELVGNLFVTTAPTSALFYESAHLQQASLLWTLATLAFAVAFGLSLALYVKEEVTRELLPVCEIRLMGTLLGVGTLGTAGASVLYYLQRDVVGIPIPAGVLVVGGLAVVLLRTERLEDERDESGDSRASESSDSETAG